MIKSPEKRRKTFWRLYFLILFASVLILLLATYFTWRTLVSETKTELQFTNRMVQSSMNSILKIDEALLKATGERLIDVGLFNNKQKAIEILDTLLSNNPAFAGVGLASLEGDVLIASSNMDASNIPNLKSTPETSKSFQKVLQSNNLVMGRTYYLDELKQWVAPIRYRISDKNHNAIAILAGGIKLTGGNSPWGSLSNQSDIELSIVRSDNYFQYYFPETVLPNQDIYSKPINEKYLLNFDKNMTKHTGYARKDLQSNPNLIVSLIYPRYPQGYSIAAISYEGTYDLFILTKKNISNLYSKLLPPIGWVALILTIFNLVLYKLFKYHEKIQLQSEKNLAYLAEHDQLTGLPNTRHLIKVFNNVIKNKFDKACVMFIDLDDFKEINDLHSHDIGDMVIKLVSKKINAFYSNSLCIRQGGDEFIVISTDTKQCIQKCEELLQLIKQPLQIDELEFSIRASVGISNYPKDGKNMNNLLRKADNAMYEAKKNRTGYFVYDESLNKNKDKQALISKELNHALEKNEMHMVYQPQIDIKNNNIIGVEALIRWENEKLGDVKPDEFIPIAESTGSIYDIGDFVINQVLSDFNTHFHQFIESYSKQNAKKFKVSLNVCTNQLVSKSHIKGMISLIKEKLHDDIRLVLEITESINLDKVDNIVENLNIIKDSGLSVSLDDFGTGFSSLSHIIKLPIDEIKIDKSFVQAIVHDKQSEILVKSIINLSRSLDVDIISEGVETSQQLEHMKKLNCQYYQGFYFSKPVDKMQLLSYLSQL